MEIVENISLKPFNSFGINVNARYFATFSSSEELIELLTYKPKVHKLILGGGSNMLFIDDFHGLVIRNNITAIDIVSEDQKTIVHHKVSAKVEYDSGGCFGALFSGLEIAFPGNGDCGRQRPVRLSRFRRSEAQHLVLARPFGRHVAEARDSHATRKPTLDGCFDEIGREECERDRHVDLPGAAAYSPRDRFDVCGWVSCKLIEPTAAPGNRCAGAHGAWSK